VKSITYNEPATEKIAGFLLEIYKVSLEVSAGREIALICPDLYAPRFHCYQQKTDIFKLAATNPKAAYRPAIEPQATSTKPDTRKAIPGPSQAPGAKPTPQQTKPTRSQTLT